MKLRKIWKVTQKTMEHNRLLVTLLGLFTHSEINSFTFQIRQEQHEEILREME